MTAPSAEAVEAALYARRLSRPDQRSEYDRMADALSAVLPLLRAQIADEIDRGGKVWCQDYGRCHHHNCGTRKHVSDTVRAAMGDPRPARSRDVLRGDG